MSLVKPGRKWGARLGDLPLRERLRAWWEGEAPKRPNPSRREAERKAPMLLKAPARTAPERDAPHWTPARIEVAQRVWGQGYVGPGGDDYVLMLVKPLGLDPSMTVLDLGVGLGGSTRLMHKAFGVWLKGYEACPELAEAGADLSAMTGLGKKALIERFDPVAFQPKHGTLDRLVVHDLLRAVDDKAALVGAFRGALKRRGRILLSEFLVEGTERDAPEVAAWSEGEPSASGPWNVDAMTICLKGLGFDLHVAEDASDLMRAMILDGWRRFEESLAGAPPAHLAEAVLAEGERWARCVAALESGALRHYRVVASV